MKKLLTVICGILLLSISGLASAGQESGFFVGGSLGSSSLDIARQSVDFSDDDLGFKVFGGYNFGIIPLLDLGVEGSYVDFGEASSAQILNQDVGITGLDLFGYASFDLGPIGLFGKVGQIWWDSDSDFIATALDDSGNDMAYGIGVKFKLGSLAIRAEYERFDTDVADIDYISAGVAWTF